MTTFRASTGRRRDGLSARASAALLGVVLVASACSGAAKPASSTPTSTTAAAATQTRTQRFESSPTDLARLEQISAVRSGGGEGGDYPIGPGDLVEVAVPGMEELRSVNLRVAGDGTLSLPLLGTIPAAGKTERQLHDEIASRLGRFMYRPQFSLAIREHHNRQVGVLGAVQTPGLHAVDGGRDTILEMISKAGGLTDDATQRLLFMPAETVRADEGQKLVASGLVAGTQETTSPTGAAGALLRPGRPIVIDLDKMNEGSQRFALNVPVRPGDTIMALGGGQVFVQGWVLTPGAYPMKRGLTALGAIGAAGGLSYPANKSTVRVLREESGNERRVISLDLERVERGEAEDIALREGDLLEIEAEGTKLAAYGVYHFFTNVMQMGFALSPF
jgi:polysaccharide biosynthesis/export protein